MLLGKGVGALILSIFGDLLGRKLLMISNLVICTLGLVITIFSVNLLMVGIGLFLALFGIQNVFQT